MIVPCHFKAVHTTWVLSAFTRARCASSYHDTGVMIRRSTSSSCEGRQHPSCICFEVAWQVIPTCLHSHPFCSAWRGGGTERMRAQASRALKQKRAGGGGVREECISYVEWGRGVKRNAPPWLKSRPELNRSRLYNTLFFFSLILLFGFVVSLPKKMGEGVSEGVKTHPHVKKKNYFYLVLKFILLFYLLITF